MPPVPPVSGANPLLCTPPELHLTDRRLDVLKRFDEQISATTIPADRIFEDFLSGFTRTGRLGILGGSCLGNSEKAQMLHRAARCHIAASRGGARFLLARQLLDRVDQDALTLLCEFDCDHRAELLGSAMLSDDARIVVALPGSELRMPLGLSCFETLSGALSVAEAGELVLRRDEEGRTLLSRFVDGHNLCDNGADGLDVVLAWATLLRQATDGVLSGDFKVTPPDINDIGSAYRALGEWVSMQEGHRVLRRMPLLISSAACFGVGDVSANEAFVWRDFAAHLALTRDEAGARTAYREASVLFLELYRKRAARNEKRYLRQLLQLGFESAKAAGDKALTAYAGERLFTIDWMIGDAPEARAVGTEMAKISDESGDQRSATHWRNRAARQVAPIDLLEQYGANDSTFSVYESTMRPMDMRMLKSVEDDLALLNPTKRGPTQ
ncbi:hypothetical protein PAN31117_00554 [Pandoraea anapnoica]|uniref:Uncharacterized protein n=1 Tax=Pandoraea anapnoica TaxID=2508301 RepID=A0A5E4ZJ29_9BURK|nr:hypothetical protein [Pandoraea anapnoica]VVE61369.1 hypothetical protein PAN31117_00554 [Pandoraea anapnoica]